MARLQDAALARLFRDARTHIAWRDEPVPESLLRELYELVALGPTANNGQPIRLVFVTTPEGKERLRPALRRGNVDKTMAAPVTAIVGYDLAFYRELPRLFPTDPDRGKPLAADPALAERAAIRNGTLQGGYLIPAARALGLDCGPMSGFDNALVDAEFFPDGTIRSNFLVNLGFERGADLPPRLARLTFEEACRIA